MDDKDKQTEYKCPKCGATMATLLFMGVQPDGFACDGCHSYYPPDKDGKPAVRPLATIF